MWLKSVRMMQQTDRICYPTITNSSTTNAKLPSSVQSLEILVNINAHPHCRIRIMQTEWRPSH